MKILLTESDQRKIDVGHRIDRIIEILQESRHILSDDIKQRRRLTIAQMSLHNLVERMRERA